MPTLSIPAHQSTRNLIQNSKTHEGDTGLQLEKGEVKVLLFAGDMILHIKYLKGFPQKTPTTNKHIM